MITHDTGRAAPPKQHRPTGKEIGVPQPNERTLLRRGNVHLGIGLGRDKGRENQQLPDPFGLEIDFTHITVPLLCGA